MYFADCMQICLPVVCLKLYLHDGFLCKYSREKSGVLNSVRKNTFSFTLKSFQASVSSCFERKLVCIYFKASKFSLIRHKLPILLFLEQYKLD